MFDNHDPMGDTLYGADISTHPKFQGQGIGTMLYMARKKLVIKLNLKRMVVGGRLYNYYEQVHKMTPQVYATITSGVSYVNELALIIIRGVDIVSRV